MMVSSIARKNWKIKQLDVRSAVLNGNLVEKKFVLQPIGFEVHGKEHQVCKLKKAPRAWYSNIYSLLFFLNMNLRKITHTTTFIIAF
jgi:hypothetical protein